MSDGRVQLEGLSVAREVAKEVVDEGVFGTHVVRPDDRNQAQAAQRCDSPKAKQAAKQRSTPTSRPHERGPEHATDRMEGPGSPGQVGVQVVAPPSTLAIAAHIAWFGAVEANADLLEDLWDERAPKGAIKVRARRRVQAAGAESGARKLALLNVIEPWVAAAELAPRRRRR